MKSGALHEFFGTDEKQMHSFFNASLTYDRAVRLWFKRFDDIPDVEKLIAVLHRLVDAGNTVIVIEHNLDIMAQADWIIDMGPEGGVDGGDVVTCGAPLDVMKTSSHTAKALVAFKREHDKIQKKLN